MAHCSTQSMVDEDDAEKHDVATLLISLSPQRTKMSSHVNNGDIREVFGSPSTGGNVLWQSPSPPKNASTVGLPDFGSPLPPTPNGFMSFAATMLSPLPATMPQTPTSAGGHAHGSASSSSSSSSSSSALSHTDHRLRGLSSASELLQNSFPLHTSSSPSSLLSMYPLDLPADDSGSGNSSNGSALFKDQSASDDSRRTKSVITPESRSKHQVGTEERFEGRPLDAESRSWISVKVSPTLTGQSLKLNPGDKSEDQLKLGELSTENPVDGTDGLDVFRSSLSSNWGSSERNDFSQAMKTINSKIQGSKRPQRNSMAADFVDAEAHQTETRGVPSAPSSVKRKKSGKAKAKASAADEDEEFEIPSPPTLGLSRARSRSSHTSQAAALFTQPSDEASSSGASSTSPPTAVSNLSLVAASTSAHAAAQSSAKGGQGFADDDVGQSMRGGRRPEQVPPAATVLPRSKPCNCKKSNCLKLYCDCFAMSRFCKGCNCKDCFNNEEHSNERNDAIKATLEKNPQAFQAKIKKGSGKHGDAGNQEHSSGCHCKKSRCLKKYCECFEAAVYCGDKCKCLDCENFEGSHQLTHRKNKSRDLRKPLSMTPLTTVGSVRLERHLETENQPTASRASSRLLAASADALKTARGGGTALSASSATTAAAAAAAGVSVPLMPVSGAPSALKGAAVQSLKRGRSEQREALPVIAPVVHIMRPLHVNPVTFVVSCGPDTKKLLISVFECLDDSELHRCSLVCKAWTQPAFDPQLWVYDHVAAEHDAAQLTSAGGELVV